MTLLDIQISVEEGGWPSEDELQPLAERVLEAAAGHLKTHAKQKFPKMATELSLVFTDDESIRAINAEWRQKDKATNVLSFPAFPITPGPGAVLAIWRIPHVRTARSKTYGTCPRITASTCARRAPTSRTNSPCPRQRRPPRHVRPRRRRDPVPRRRNLRPPKSGGAWRNCGAA